MRPNLKLGGAEPSLRTWSRCDQELELFYDRPTFNFSTLHVNMFKLELFISVI